MMTNTATRPVAIVTGASRRNALGAAICRALAGSGHDIYFTHWSSYDKAMYEGVAMDEPALIQAELEELRGSGCAPFS